jgi:hypothetical protein
VTDFTHTITEKWSSGGRSIEDSHTHSADAQSSIDIDIADATTDQLVDFVLDVSEIKSFFMVADGIITIETNSSSAPPDSWTTVANVPIVWHSDSPHANPFSVDVTALYLTNASGASVRFQLEVVFDSTP